MKLKSKKSALLLSFTSLLLCFAMLAGSTFAWFTDTATTGVNKIVAGNLKVDIVAEDGVTSLTGADGKLYWTQKQSAGGQATAVTDADKPLWEPGVTFLTQGFKIKNDGNLALKWKMTVNKENIENGKADASAKDGMSLLDVIDFSVVTDQAKDAEAVKIEEFVGHLEKEKTSEKTYYIKAHMQETAGNDYQSLTLDGITITVYATQLNHENDSFGPDYDEDAPLDFVPVGTAAELKSVFANAAGGDVNVSLTDDIDLGADNTLMIVDENSNVGDINIQANGHTVKNASDAVRVLQIAKSDAARTITITGAKVVSESTTAGYNANENRGVQLYGVKNATVNLVNCEIEMKANDFSYAIKMINCDKVTLNLTGCTLTGANCIETNGGGETGNIINITDCVLNSNYAPNATYSGNGIQDKNGTNNTYNIKNTTFNGTNAQPWQTSSTTVINDLGGNVYNTTRTTN